MSRRGLRQVVRRTGPTGRVAAALLLVLGLLTAARADAGDRRLRRWREGGNECREFGAPRIQGFEVAGHRFTPRWIARTLHGVIADHCGSKRYTDILALDGGTVGIAHFATGSLRTLHRHMDLARYFGEHARHVPDRPYHLSWWRAGMRRFLYSRESRAVQQRAWRAFISPALALALRHGWSTDRELAIAAGVANSLGAIGFQRLASWRRWNPEDTLHYYAKMTSHKERRRLRINREFPRDEGLVSLAPQAPSSEGGKARRHALR